MPGALAPCSTAMRQSAAAPGNDRHAPSRRRATGTSAATSRRPHHRHEIPPTPTGVPERRRPCRPTTADKNVGASPVRPAPPELRKGSTPRGCPHEHSRVSASTSTRRHPPTHQAPKATCKAAQALAPNRPRGSTIQRALQAVTTEPPSQAPLTPTPRGLWHLAATGTHRAVVGRQGRRQRLHGVEATVTRSHTSHEPCLSADVPVVRRRRTNTLRPTSQPRNAPHPNPA